MRSVAIPQGWGPQACRERSKVAQAQGPLVTTVETYTPKPQASGFTHKAPQRGEAKRERGAGKICKLMTSQPGHLPSIPQFGLISSSHLSCRLHSEPARYHPPALPRLPESAHAQGSPPVYKKEQQEWRSVQAGSFESSCSLAGLLGPPGTYTALGGTVFKHKLKGNAPQGSQGLFQNAILAEESGMQTLSDLLGPRSQPEAQSSAPACPSGWRARKPYGTACGLALTALVTLAKEARRKQLLPRAWGTVEIPG